MLFLQLLCDLSACINVIRRCLFSFAIHVGISYMCIYYHREHHIYSSDTQRKRLTARRDPAELVCEHLLWGWQPLLKSCRGWRVPFSWQSWTWQIPSPDQQCPAHYSQLLLCPGWLVPCGRSSLGALELLAACWPASARGEHWGPGHGQMSSWLAAALKLGFCLPIFSTATCLCCQI